jgi:SUKH-3 immunity protein
MNEDRFSHDVVTTLCRAGWSPSRRVDLDVWREPLTIRGNFVLSEAAEAALSDFGSLKVEQHGPGIECARESFDLNPLVATGYEAEFVRVAHAVGEKSLFPLGQVVGGQAFLGIAPSGSIYYFMESIGLLGHSIDEALTRMIDGRKPLRVWDIDVTEPDSE